MDDPLPPRCPSCDRLLVDDQGAARLRDELLAERFRGGPAFGPPASSGRARLATATRAIYRGEAEQ